MGFNIGVGLGSAATSGMSTYEKLTEEETRALQNKKLKQDLANEASEAASFTKNSAPGASDAQATFDKGIDYGDAGQNAAVRTQLGNLAPDQQQTVLRSLAGSSVDRQAQAPTSAIPTDAVAPDAGPAAPVAAQTPAPAPQQGIDLANAVVKGGAKKSAEEISSGVMADMISQGNTKGYQNAAAMNKMAREATMNANLDKHVEDMAKTQTEFDNSLKANGTVGTAKLFKDRLAAEGVKIAIIKGKDGADAVGVIGADGKISQTFTTPAQMQEAFTEAHQRYGMQQLSQMKGATFADHMSLAKQRSEDGYRKKVTDNAAAKLPAELEQLYAAAGASRASAAASAASTKIAQQRADTEELNGASLRSYHEGIETDRAAGKWDATLENPDTHEIGMTNPKKPGEVQDPLGNRITDVAGYRSKAFKESPIVAQARDAAEATVASKAIDPKTSQPYTLDGAKTKFYSDLHKANTPEGLADAGAQKLVQAGRAAGQDENELNGAFLGHYNRLGIAPPTLRTAMESGVSPKTGQPFTAEEVKQLATKYPNTAKAIGFKAGEPDTAAPASAIPNNPRSVKPAPNAAPVVDNTRYSRVSNNRGGWEYQQSGKGLTRAQYAEIDAKKKAQAIPH